MKKIIMLALVTALLVTSLASCARTRRNEFENILESRKEAESLAESLADVPQVGANGEANIIGTIITPADWNVSVQKLGDTPYFEGKTTEELFELYRQNGKQEIFAIMPTGRTIQANNGSTWFYNKLTGNILPWCPDQLCDGGEDCMFNLAWSDSFELVSYVGKEHFYFRNMYKDFVYKLYRCDFQRNNVELLYTIPTYDGASNNIEIVCEEGNMLYFLEAGYGGRGGAAVNSLKRLNMDTKKAEVISGDLSFSWCYYIRGELYYQLRGSEIIYKNTLAFDQETEFLDEQRIANYSDKYIIYSPNMEYGESDDLTIYNIETGETRTLPDNGYELAGDYVYYTKMITAEELETHPHKDYFSWKNDHRFTPRQDGIVYRMNVNTGAEEVVCSVYYKDKPVQLSLLGVDGECIWLTIQNYEQWQNYYNQDFNGNTAMRDYLVVVDLHDGTMRFIETDGAGEEIRQYS